MDLKRIISILRCVAVGYLLLDLIIFLNVQHHSRAHHHHLKKFSAITELNTFKEAAPQSFFPQKKYDEVTLLLHGYSDSPRDFHVLSKHLKAQNIAFYAPQIMGFGLGDLDLLSQIKVSDWKRQVIHSYDFLSHIAHKINVVGCSNGGSLALYLSTRRPIHHLVLVAPNAFVHEEDQWEKNMLLNAVIAKPVLWLKPRFVKPTRDNRTSHVDISAETVIPDVFHYQRLPTSSLIALWQLQEDLDLQQIEYGTLDILYGAHDLTVDIDTLLSRLNAFNKSYKQHKYEHSAHSVLIDVDKEQAVRDVIDILQSKQ